MLQFITWRVVICKSVSPHDLSSHICQSQLITWRVVTQNYGEIFFFLGQNGELYILIITLAKLESQIPCRPAACNF